MIATAPMAWLVLFLPVLAFAILVFLRPWRTLGNIVSILAVAASFALSLIIFAGILGQAGHGEPLQASLPFISVGQFQFPFTIQIDSLTALMLVVVTGVSLLVQIFSLGYMSAEDDRAIRRFYAYLSLFTTSMLGLVLARNLVLVFAFWELVGLSSFLLIGFWFGGSPAHPVRRPPEDVVLSPAAAAMKAFVTTRVGDFGFMIALIALFAAAGTLDIPTLIEKAEHHEIAAGLLTLACLGLFAGAVGKSAQFPLHVWLPDAMEGPTPVSALIHAATMVAAGVYLVARTFPLFEAAPAALSVVAWIGGFTALFAATMGLTQHDLKRVMAYSTISQLGYMMLGLGVGSLVAGVFHLFTHAFFKALLFLGSGSVIHGTGNQDMREMGGLRKVMPYTTITLFIASLSLAGIPPFAGFFSKDEILAETLKSGNVALFVMGQATVVLTAFYITRLMILTFAGEYRGPNPAIEAARLAKSERETAEQQALFAAGAANGDHGHDAAGHEHRHADHGGHGNDHHEAPAPHESPWVMLIPLLVLAVPSVVAGFWSLGGGFHHFLEAVPGVHAEVPQFNVVAALISVAMAVLGIVGALIVYRGAPQPNGYPISRLAPAFGPLYTLVNNQYYLDRLYGWFNDRVTLGLSRALAWFDVTIVDGVVNGVGSAVTLASEGMRRWQTGYVQNYGLYFLLGAILVFIIGYAGAGALVGR